MWDTYNNLEHTFSENYSRYEWDICGRLVIDMIDIFLLRTDMDVVYWEDVKSKIKNKWITENQ
jgi:hypothetical protein